MMPQALYNPELQCAAVGAHYDFSRREGTLYIADGNCCDMDGCVNFFRRVDADVRQIQTIAGGRNDTRYTRRRGQWVAA